MHPAFVPAGLPQGRVVVGTGPNDPRVLVGDYRQTYLGDGVDSRSRAVGHVRNLPLGSGTGTGTVRQATLGGKDVTIAQPIENPGTAAVRVVLDGRPVTLAGSQLTDGDFARILTGIRPRTDRPGWDLTNLPRGLRLRGEGYVNLGYGG